MACNCGERLNIGSHVAALVLSLAGGSSLLLKTLEGGDARKILGVFVFVSAMVTLYAASVLFHWTSGPRKRLWQRADHASIYLLIAGTYTPFALAGSASAWQLSMLVAMWLLAGWGVWRELCTDVSTIPLLGIYVAMGWLGVLGAVPAAATHAGATLAWLVVGALFYSMGTGFYRNPKGRRHAHGIWHLFVLAGSASHFLAIAAIVA